PQNKEGVCKETRRPPPPPLRLTSWRSSSRTAPCVMWSVDTVMKLICALAISYATLLAQTDKPEIHTVTAVRNWSLADVTRVAIEISGSFQIRADRLNNPDRV